jgi:uncharacterized damage-inducible protein DinB
MELAARTCDRYARLAFERLLAVADRAGDDRVNEPPAGPHTNSIASLIVHCCGVCEFWLGHVGLGRESHRDRGAELVATATVAELHAMVEVTLAQLQADLVAVDGAPVSPYAAPRQHLAEGDQSDASLVLHVLEELFQHLGHAELSADALGVAPVGA